jgi:hypothetical protein
MKTILGISLVAVMLVLVAAPASAATKVKISKNGSKSTNGVALMFTKMQTVKQSNNANVYNGVMVATNTGGNTANGNTGDGGVMIESGKTQTGVMINNTVNSNEAKLVGCGCESDAEVVVSENGTKSENGVMMAELNAQAAEQGNKAEVGNEVEALTNSGENEAKNNTGEGDVKVKTGMTTTMVDLMTTANYNWVVVK